MESSYEDLLNKLKSENINPAMKKLIDWMYDEIDMQIAMVSTVTYQQMEANINYINSL